MVCAVSAQKSSLPASWGRKKLRDLIQPRETTNPAKSADGTFQYVDIEALDNTKQLITSHKKLNVKAAPSRARVAIRKGDVVFSLVRPYLKNIAVVPENLDGAVASTAFCQLRPNADIDNRFLFYQLIQDSFIHSIPTYGSSPPAARDEEFLDLAVVVAPIEEQEWAVSKIEELFSDVDAGIAALERARAKLKRYRLESWDGFLTDFCRHWPTDRDHVYVDFVRDRMESVWKPGMEAREGSINEFRLCER